MEVLQKVPATDKRSRRELRLLMTLGAELMVLHGYASPEAEPVYARARALCTALGNAPDLFPVRWGQFAFYLVRGDHGTACDVAEELWALAQELDDSGPRLFGHWAMAAGAFTQGDFVAADRHLRECIRLYDPCGMDISPSSIGTTPEWVLMLTPL